MEEKSFIKFHHVSGAFSAKIASWMLVKKTHNKPKHCGETIASAKENYFSIDYGHRLASRGQWF